MHLLEIMLSKLELFATFEVTRCSDCIEPRFKRATRVAYTRFQCRLVRLPRINRDNQEQKRSKMTILDSKCNPQRGKI